MTSKIFSELPALVPLTIYLPFTIKAGTPGIRYL